MIRTGQTTTEFQFGRAAWIVVYTFFAMLIQIHLVSQLPYQALRIDLLLPLMFAAAVGWSPLGGLIWAAFWGFLADNFSGQFWGLHVGSYAVAVCLVHMASERFDCYNPFYQMGLAGLCAMGQSVALGLFLSFVPMDLYSLTETWIGLCIRTVLSMTTAPFLIYPILSPRSPF